MKFFLACIFLCPFVHVIFSPAILLCYILQKKWPVIDGKLKSKQLGLDYRELEKLCSRRIFILVLATFMSTYYIKMCRLEGWCAEEAKHPMPYPPPQKRP